MFLHIKVVAQPDSPEWRPGSAHDSAPSRSKGAAAAALQTGRVRRKRDPGSHTSREPKRIQFTSTEEFDRAWARWRELRDSNNDAVGGSVVCVCVGGVLAVVLHCY